MNYYQLAHLPAKEFLRGFWGRAIHTQMATLIYWEVDPEAVLPLHQHPHEQIVNLLEGEFEMTIEGKTYLLKAGDVLVIPSGALHEGRAMSKPCKILDVFCPVREDYKI
ncbi:MAG: cupin domain-containing protein [Cytophagales bacterium]|nr:cupin domain-containing protein [Bernardetiaceae bacterium]MDW8211013.1 cupin domain-containing protein [Cytophagales bacterium]